MKKYPVQGCRIYTHKLPKKLLLDKDGNYPKEEERIEIDIKKIYCK